MARQKKKKTRKKTAKKKTNFFAGVARFGTLILLFFVLAFSVCAVGYVIFFRTVFAQEIVTDGKIEIVFEEPDPPDHEEVGMGDGAIRESDLPKVAIILDDMGYHELLGEKLLELPFELTYSFLPFAPHTRKLERLAHRHGKTVFLHLPLQAKSKDWDPGPGALFLDDSPKVQREKLNKCLEEVPHAVGINNHMGSLFTEDESAMVRLMHEIEDRSLFFVDSYTTAHSVGFRTAQELEIKSAKRHVFLDNTLTTDKICEQMEKLVRGAEKRGWGIGIAHPHKETFEAISTCGESFRTRVQYVSVKDVLY